MARVWMPIAAFLISWIGMAHAGEISRIQVLERTVEKVVILIEGNYRAYQAHGRSDPARLGIDLEAARMGKEVSKIIAVDGRVVSRIEAGDTEKGIRVVVYSAEPARLFDFEIEEESARLRVTCRPAKSANVAHAEPREKVLGAGTERISREDYPNAPRFSQSETEGRQEPDQVVSYSGEKVTLDFYKTDIHNVFRLFAEISGKNIIVDERVSGELTLALKEVPWDLAMEIILEAKDLMKEEKENIFIIRPKPEKKEGGEGILVVRRFEEGSLEAAQRSKEERDHRQDTLSLLIEAREAEKKRTIDEALALYERAFLLWKDNPNLLKENIDVLKRMAYLFYTVGNAAKTRYFAAEALELNPADADSAHYAALASAKLGNEDDARLFFDIAIRSGRPLLPEAFYNYGLFLEESGDTGDALFLFQRYEELFGPSAGSSLAIARLSEGQGNTTKACEKYREISRGGVTLDEREADLVRRKIEALCYHGR